MKQLFANEKHLLSDCKVVKDGKISRFGTVHILLNSVQEPEENKEIGLECWSAELHRFRHGNFKAEIKNDYLVIINEAGKKVYDIAVTDILSIDSRYVCTAMEGGWLMSNGWLMNGCQIEKSGKSTAVAYLGALLRAEKGETPDILDDKSFTKISPEFVGSSVVCLLHKGLSAKELSVKVFTEDGQMIDSETSWPLSREKWAQSK